MIKTSIKKSYTVFVALVLILILGVVSFMNMTPDLLPNMDLPYAIVVTTAPGASPEEIEFEVTKPMEQQLATLENINNINSTSSENMSMITLEFTSDVNMDNITVEIREKIDMVSGQFDETVGVPFVMKINPDMMPISVIALSMEDMNTVELSSFVNDILKNQLEGIEGIASLAIDGLIDETVEVTISQEKIDLLNMSIQGAIDREFGDAINELNSAISKSKEALAEMAKMKKDLTDKQVALSLEIDKNQGQIDSVLSPLLAHKNELLAEIQNQTLVLVPLQQTYQSLLIDKDTLVYYNEQIQYYEDNSLTADPAYTQVVNDKANLIVKLTAMGINPVSEASIDAKLLEIDAQLQPIKGVIDGLNAQYTALESNMLPLEESITKLEKVKLETSAGINSGLMKIVVQENTLVTTIEELEVALEDMDENIQSAYEGADLNTLVTMDTVSQILTAQNFSMPAGYVKEEKGEYLVKVGDKIAGVEELQDMLLFDLGMDGLAPIQLEDVADVNLVDNSNEIYARLGSGNAVLVSFTKQSSFATATASENIVKEMEYLQDKYDGLSFIKLMDQGDYIKIVINTVLNNLITGAILAVIILILFLKDLKPTMIVGLSIPISVTFAIVLMYFSGVTLNIISLSGLAVGVGMLVDNSIVVIENIYRLRQSGMSAIKSAFVGTKQVVGAIIASTLTTVCVFLPIVFVEGITKQLFVDMALTIGYSLIASLLIAITFVPAMASRVFAKLKPQKATIFDRIVVVYEKLLKFALSKRTLVIILALVLLIGSFVMTLSRGFSFMPEMQATELSVNLKINEDKTFEQSVEISDEVIDKIMQIDGVKTVGAMMMSQDMFSGKKDSSNISMYVLFEEESNRTISEITEDISTNCVSKDYEVEVAGSGMSMSALTGTGVTVYIYGDDLDSLEEQAVIISERMANVDGVDEVDNLLKEATKEIKISVDKTAAMKKSLTVAQVYMEVSKAIKTNSNATTIKLEHNDVDVVLISENAENITIDDLKNHTFEVKDNKGETSTVKLSEISDIEESFAMNSVYRYNQRAYISVNATIQEGYNINLVASDIEKNLNEYEMPAGMSIEYSGENESIMEAMVDLLGMLALGIIIVYLIMVAQFQSLLAPFIVMFTIPLAFTGGFIALFITGGEISVISMIGFVMLVGIIVNNAIVLIDYIIQLRAGGMNKYDAIIASGTTRLRPVLMTALTTILGLLPLAMGIGVGSDSMQPVAIVCIGGLSYATIMTLFVIPVIYDLFNKKELKVVRDEELTQQDGEEGVNI